MELLATVQYVLTVFGLDAFKRRLVKFLESINQDRYVQLPNFRNRLSKNARCIEVALGSRYLVDLCAP